ncbi:MAG: hypothetical protein ACI822_003258, partial [Gammaproteobacteria bacterium]
MARFTGVTAKLIALFRERVIDKLRYKSARCHHHRLP